MSNVGKIFLYTYSFAPLLWTAIILTNSYFGNYEPNFKQVLIFSAKAYFYAGFLLWTALLIFMTWKRKISKADTLINIALVLIGIFAAYYSISHDIFCVSGCYID